MKVEFAKIDSRYGQVTVTEVASLGSVSDNGGELKFAGGSSVQVERLAKSRFTDCVFVDLSGLTKEGLFHGRHLRKVKEIALGADGGGCAQIDKNWMVVVHSRNTSGIYDRLGKKDHGGYHRESYWHL